MEDAAPRSGPHSIGAYLATQRCLRGISVEQLASQTRIPLRSLERLESGCFDSDVDGFVRGFVRTVAEALGLDPDETLNRALEEPGQTNRPRSAPRLSLRRVLAALVGIALLAGAGFLVQLVAASLAAEAAPEAPPHFSLRRDPIRALAEAQGIAGLAPAPALSLAASQGERPQPPRDTVAKPGRSIAGSAAP